MLWLDATSNTQFEAPNRRSSASRASWKQAGLGQLQPELHSYKQNIGPSFSSNVMCVGVCWCADGSVMCVVQLGRSFKIVGSVSATYSKSVASCCMSVAVTDVLHSVMTAGRSDSIVTIQVAADYGHVCLCLKYPAHVLQMCVWSRASGCEVVSCRAAVYMFALMLAAARWLPPSTQLGLLIVCSEVPVQNEEVLQQEAAVCVK